jgi:hypothetical protein
MSRERTESSSRQDRSHRQLLDWFTEGGGELLGLAPSQANGLRGLHAKHAIAAGTCVMRVPWRLAVTQDVARRSLNVAPRRVQCRDWSSQEWLTAFVLDTHRHGGFWSPMIDSYPRAFEGHPLHMPPARLDWLSGSVVHGKVLAARLSMEHARQRVEAAFRASERGSAAAWRWAHTCVSTRKFDSVRQAGDAKLLWPVVDLLNHASSPNVAWQEDAQELVVVARRDIAPGEPATASYFRQPNSTIYALHGFCGEPVADDDALLGVADASAPPRADGVPTLRFFLVSARGDAKPAQEMFEFLRSQCGDEVSMWSALRDACVWRATLLDPRSPQGLRPPRDPGPMSLQALQCEIAVVQGYFDLARQQLAALRCPPSAFAECGSAQADSS